MIIEDRQDECDTETIHTIYIPKYYTVQNTTSNKPREVTRLIIDGNVAT